MTLVHLVLDSQKYRVTTNRGIFQKDELNSYIRTRMWLGSIILFSFIMRRVQKTCNKQCKEDNVDSEAMNAVVITLIFFLLYLLWMALEFFSVNLPWGLVNYDRIFIVCLTESRKNITFRAKLKQLIKIKRKQNLTRLNQVLTFLIIFFVIALFRLQPLPFSEFCFP